MLKNLLHFHRFSPPRICLQIFPSLALHALRVMLHWIIPNEVSTDIIIRKFKKYHYTFKKYFFVSVKYRFIELFTIWTCSFSSSKSKIARNKFIRTKDPIMINVMVYMTPTIPVARRTANRQICTRGSSDSEWNTIIIGRGEEERGVEEETEW